MQISGYRQMNGQTEKTVQPEQAPTFPRRLLSRSDNGDCYACGNSACRELRYFRCEPPPILALHSEPVAQGPTDLYLPPSGCSSADRSPVFTDVVLKLLVQRLFWSLLIAAAFFMPVFYQVGFTGVSISCPDGVQISTCNSGAAKRLSRPVKTITSPATEPSSRPTSCARLTPAP